MFCDLCVMWMVRFRLKSILVLCQLFLSLPSRAGSASVSELYKLLLLYAMNRIYPFNVPHLPNFSNQPNLDLPELKIITGFCCKVSQLFCIFIWKALYYQTVTNGTLAHHIWCLNAIILFTLKIITNSAVSINLLH